MSYTICTGNKVHLRLCLHYLGATSCLLCWESLGRLTGGSVLGNFLCSGSQGESVRGLYQVPGLEAGVVLASAFVLSPLPSLSVSIRFHVHGAATGTPEMCSPGENITIWCACVLLDYKNQIFACPRLVPPAQVLTGGHLGSAF